MKAPEDINKHDRYQHCNGAWGTWTGVARREWLRFLEHGEQVWWHPSDIVARVRAV